MKHVAKPTMAEEILELGLNSDPQIFHRSQLQEPLRKKQIAFINRFLSQALDMAAQECDKIDDALNDGTITKEEDPTWPYSRASVIHTNASIYVERAAIAIRKLKKEAATEI